MGANVCSLTNKEISQLKSVVQFNSLISVFAGTREGDVYSFGIVCHEIIDCSGPFNSHDDYGIGADGL